jgi:hypothetical protein
MDYGDLGFDAAVDELYFIDNFGFHCFLHTEIDVDDEEFSDTIFNEPKPNKIEFEDEFHNRLRHRYN